MPFSKLHHVTWFLIACLFLNSSADEFNLTTKEREWLYKLHLSGATTNQSRAIPIERLQEFQGVGAVICPEGFSYPTPQGFVSCRWEHLLAVNVFRGNFSPQLRGYRSLVPLINVQKTEASEGEDPKPYLSNGEEFLAALTEASGLQMNKADSSRGKFRRPTETIFFKMEGAEAWEGRWTYEEFAKLGSRPGVTLNRVGMAWVDAYETKAIKWKCADTMTFDPGNGHNREKAKLDVFRKEWEEYGPKTRGWPDNGIHLWYPDHHFLPFQNMKRLRDTLSHLKTAKGFRAPSEDIFFPFHATSQDMVEMMTPLGFAEAEQSVKPTHSDVNYWPNNAAGSGLYLLPTGILKIEDCFIRRIPWQEVTELDGSVDGSMRFTPLDLTFAAKDYHDSPLYRVARSLVIQMANLELQTSGSIPYKADVNRQIKAPKRGLKFTLGKESEWYGLPLAILGKEKWPEGLQISKDGLISVQEHKITMLPWSEIKGIRIVRYPSGEDFVLAVPRWRRQFSLFPPKEKELQLVNETSMGLRAIFEIYLEIHEDGGISVRADAPDESTFLRYLRAGEAESELGVREQHAPLTRNTT